MLSQRTHEDNIARIFTCFNSLLSGMIEIVLGSLKTLERRVLGGVQEAGKIMAAVKTLLEADRCLPKLHALFRDRTETPGGCWKGCTKCMYRAGWRHLACARQVPDGVLGTERLSRICI